MIHRDGDLFTASSLIIGHGVNCAGLMGAGIAKQFKAKYPHNFLNYEAACKAGQLKPGQVHVNFERDKYIVNMATQKMPGADATYPRVFEAAYHAAVGARRIGYDRIAIPEIASKIGGLEWSKVEEVLTAVESVVSTKDYVFNW